MKPCKDCAAEGITTIRPAPHPGPRCHTHHLRRRRESKTQRHEKYVQNQYGLPEGDYDKLVEFQEGKCAICERATGRTKYLSTDHDHKCCDGPKSCGECVRGALCSPCNKLLGHGRDDPEFFRRAARYLENPPYKRMRNQ